MRLYDITGRTFHRLTVLSYLYHQHGRSYWLCQCTCGTTLAVQAKQLGKGHAQSCGCLRKETLIKRNTTHGATDTPEYAIWGAMKTRCYNPHFKDYRNYGGRGIVVSEAWHDFRQFLADMGPRPSPKHSLDRINNDGPYSAENCRWATAKEQVKNRRRPQRASSRT